MNNIYETIVSNNVYLVIVIGFLAIIAFSVLKKLFKVALILLFCFAVYVVYLMYTGQNVKEVIEENVDGATDFFEENVDGVKETLDVLKDKILDSK